MRFSAAFPIQHNRRSAAAVDAAIEPPGGGPASRPGVAVVIGIVRAHHKVE